MFKQLPSFTAKTLSLTVALLLTFGLTYAYATWTEPNTAPPNANAYAPLNTGPDSQTKTGSITSSGDITAKNLKATGDIYTNGGKIYAGSGVYVKQSGKWIKLKLGGSTVTTSAPSLPGPTTFGFTNKAQTYTVPAGASAVKIQVWGAQGGSGSIHANNKGGKGGYAKGILAVHSGEMLRVYAGGQNGYNGGGGWEMNLFGNFFGGGASDVRVGGNGLNKRVIVAGGGGSGAWVGNGGNGGGYAGKSGYYIYGGYGRGGTQTHGGSCGYCGSKGLFGIGGSSSHNSGYFLPVAGGGGGWYGGSSGSGGGGGSSYTGKVSGGSTTSGVRSGNGKVIITPIQ